MLEVVFCVCECVGVCEVQPCLYLCMRAQKQMGTEVGVFKTWRAITNGFVCLYTQILANMCVGVCVCVCNVVIIRVYIHHAPSQSALAGSSVVTISEG